MDDDKQEIKLPKDIVVVYSTDDEKINNIGKLLSYESSRKILMLLMSETLTAKHITEKTNYDLTLVKHHLNRMLEVGIVKITKVEKSVKLKDMKYYAASQFAVVILSPSVSERAKKSKMLNRSLKMIYKLSSVGIAGIVTWFSTQFVQNNNLFQDSYPILPRQIDPDIAVDISPFLNTSHDWSVIFTGLVMFIGLFFIWYKKTKKVKP